MNDPQKNQETSIQHLMTAEQLKVRLERIKYHYTLMYPFAAKHPKFDELDFLTPEDFAEDVTVMRDFIQSTAEFK